MFVSGPDRLAHRVRRETGFGFDFGFELRAEPIVYELRQTAPVATRGPVRDTSSRKAMVPATLRKIALNLSRSDWANEKGYAFYCQSRAFCNFVERSIVGRKLLCAASKIVIEGVLEAEPTWAINSCDILRVTMPFDYRRFEVLKEASDKYEFFISFARAGLDVLTTLPRTTRDALEGTFQDFRVGGYANIWQHKKRTFRAERFSVALG